MRYILNDYFTLIAMDIGFKDDIPDEFQAADGLQKILIDILITQVLIKSGKLQILRYLYFIAVNNKGIGNITWHD